MSTRILPNVGALVQVVSGPSRGLVATVLRTWSTGKVDTDKGPFFAQDLEEVEVVKASARRQSQKLAELARADAEVRRRTGKD